MSTPGGGHAAHLTSSSREQQNGGAPNKNVGSGSGGTGGKIPPQQHLLSNHQPQLINSSNEPLHQQLAGSVHASTHLHSHTDLDPRVMSGGGAGGHHGPPPPPPPKVEAIGMIDGWTRMPPQYASQPTSLEPQFISSSPAAYYHAPVSPYGAAYPGIGSETPHAGAPWSNGTDVASYFGYPPGPPASADFHHPESMSIPGMFGNGYPAGTYGAPSNFGYSPFTPTHTAPGPAVSQDYTGWTPTTPHDLLERGAHQKNPYGDYYSYDLIGAAAPNMMPPTAAALDMGSAPIAVSCDERVKCLANQIENLSIAPVGQSLVFGNSNREFEQQQRQVADSRSTAAGGGGAVKTEVENPKKVETPLHQENSTEVVSNRGANGDSKFRSASKVAAPPAVSEKAENNNNDDAFKSDDHDVNKVIASSGSKDAPIPRAQAFPTAGGRDSPTASSTNPNQEPSTSNSPEVGSHGETAVSDGGAATTTTTKPSISLSNWNWIDDEVKDWSASPPPPPAPATLPVLSNEVSSSSQNEDDCHQGEDNGGGVDEQASTHLLQDLIRKNNYNPSELNARIEGARFFVIKSYSEDDVHRSIKYSIWCSTEHGNKKLDQAFCHQKNNGANGPIYLFYSVNGSGHFCGMAQMTSSVDYDTMTGVWAQDKWKGKFSVKWIYVKDIPNPELRHIRLENNENKPVTNSRDTQEIPPEKGRQVLEIMHNYRHETSLFDDFVYYEDMEHKREAERENHHTKDRNSPSSGARSALTTTTTFRNFPPKRKDYGDDVREGHPSNGNHHHHHQHHHRDNHHHGKDYHHRTDSRDLPRNSAVSGARSFSGGGASASNSGSYNHNRESNSRGFGGGYRGEADPPRSSNHVGRSFTNFRRNTDRDRDYTGNERTFFSNRYNTTERNDSSHWRS